LFAESAIMREMTEHNECRQMAASAKLRNLFDVRNNTILLHAYNYQYIVMQYFLSY